MSSLSQGVLSAFLIAVFGFLSWEGKSAVTLLSQTDVDT